MLIKQIHLKTGVRESAIRQVMTLLEDGATVPFIARYRKEKTGSLDEVEITQIQQELDLLVKLEKRKETILKAIKEQKKLTPELTNKIQDCWSASDLEDIYLPYKKSRKTKADVARTNGLEPLAKIICSQKSKHIEQDSKRFIRGNIGSISEALEGARHIIAEWVNENLSIRKRIRSFFQKHATLNCKVIAKKKSEAIKYEIYFDYTESLKKSPSHRILAIYRGVTEGLLKMKITIDDERAFNVLTHHYINSRGACAEQLQLALRDALKRLILPSLENEFKKLAKEKADVEAIEIFAKNLRQLLLSPPLGEQSVIALDPGFRTGCKSVALNHHGTLMDHSTIYPHPPQTLTLDAENKIRSWIKKYRIKHIAIGNGTAGRETYRFLQDLNLETTLHMVNENGASIYSASQIARDEFPELDLTVRGAISIGRRLMDPLAELVKIDPKSIGVGQYQHDVNQTLLKESLDRTIISCVNAVGINLNTASKHLLQYVAGIGPALADNIVKYRNKNGAFSNRHELLEVPRMGQKAFEQAAGFLRIRNGDQILDNTGIHPERYKLVNRMLKDNKLPKTHLNIEKEKLESIPLKNYLTDEIGMPTLRDIIEELKKPGFDTRGDVTTIEYAAHIRTIEDLEPGIILTGIVNNLTKFGAFIDIGIKESGLVHISQITNRFIKDPSEVLSLGQEVSVKILEVDEKRKRISLSMKF